MSIFFTRTRFAKPQLIAVFLLACFLTQCVWLAAHALGNLQSDAAEFSRVQGGLRQWKGLGVAGTPEQAWGPALVSEPDQDTSSPSSSRAHEGYDTHHSPLYYLVASAPLLLWHGELGPASRTDWGWFARAPFIVVGLLMGASLWYVAHRLYSNLGGYVVLALYSFSPGMLRSSAGWFAGPEILAVWGAFGSVFTAIALAHTLYAPREVVLWNWRRILLLGLSLALGIGAQFSLIVLIPIVLILLLYLAPERKQAALVIWVVACIIGVLILFATYSFHSTTFWGGILHAHFVPFSGRALFMVGNYRQLISQLTEGSQALGLAIPAALVGYVLWPRARYFGNTAPLIIAALFLLVGLVMPHYPGLGFRILALPFLFLFVGGVFSDALDSAYHLLIQAVAWGWIAAYALWNVMDLARVSAT
jgi:hypothetical protein